MTYCLYRDAFLDRVWGPADLDAVAVGCTWTSPTPSATTCAGTCKS